MFSFAFKFVQTIMYCICIVAKPTQAPTVAFSPTTVIPETTTTVAMTTSSNSEFTLPTTSSVDEILTQMPTEKVKEMVEEVVTEETKNFDGDSTFEKVAEVIKDAVTNGSDIVYDIVRSGNETLKDMAKELVNNGSEAVIDMMKNGSKAVAANVCSNVSDPKMLGFEPEWQMKLNMIWFYNQHTINAII